MLMSVGTHLLQPHGGFPGLSSSFAASPLLLAAFSTAPSPFPSTIASPGRSPDAVCNRIKHTGVTDKARTRLPMINPVSELYLQTAALPQSPHAVVSPYSER